MTAVRPNRSSVRDLTEGNIYKLILSFAFPIFISQVFQQLYNTADTLIVGAFLGTESLAAVASSGTLIFLFTSFFDGTAMGAGVVISRYFGAGDKDRVSRAIHTNIAFGIVSGLFLTVAGVFLSPFLLELMNTDPKVLPEAIEYFRYYFLGSLSVIMYNVCRGIMNALGDSKRPLIYLIFSSLVNIVLDILFVGVFRFGVWSAAVATVISQSASVVLCLIHLTKKDFEYRIKFKSIRFHGDILKEIIRYGMPSGVQNSVIALANVIVQSQINSFGRFATAAYGAHCKIEGFVFLPIMSFNMATTTFISQNLGAGKKERAKKGANFGIISVVLLAEAIGAIYYLLAPKLISFFDSSPQVIEFGVRQARTVTLFYCLLALSHSIAAVCRGAGKAFVPMIVMLSVWCVGRISYIMVVMHFFGSICHVYWAYPITWGISSVIYLLYYKFSNWINGFDNEKELLEERK